MGVPVGGLLNSQHALAGDLLPGSRMQADHLVGADAHRVGNALSRLAVASHGDLAVLRQNFDSKIGVGVEAFPLLSGITRTSFWFSS